MTSLSKISSAFVLEISEPIRVKAVQEDPNVKKFTQEKPDSKAIVEDVNTKLSIIGTRIVLSYDTEMGKEIIKVIDAKTNEVIRQIPSEEILRISRQIDYLIGVFYDAAK